MHKRILNLFRNLWRRHEVEQALDEELQASVEILAQEKTKQGFSPSASRRLAHIELGGLEQVKEEVRAVRAGRFLEDVGRDLGVALRVMAKSPGFTMVAVTTLALGIGANTAIFSVVNTTFLRPLPYPDPDRLFWITERNRISARDGSVSYPNFLDWRGQQDAFSELSIYQVDRETLRTAQVVEQLPTLLVSRGFFRALGVRMVQGRDMVAEDDQPGASPAAWISHEAWQRYFAADPGVVGRAISLQGRPVAVAGILPADFRFIEPADVYLALAPYAEQMGLTTRTRRASTFVIGRLKPGATLQGAQTQANTIAQRLERQYPEANTGIMPSIRPLHEHVVGSARTQLFLLLGAVGMVLLIACVNLANLLLARSAGRQKEMAIRTALGASRVQLMRQLLVESVLLATAGGVVGGLLGLWSYRLVFRLVPLGMQQISDAGIGLDIRVLLFLASVTLATGIGFGLAPAWQLSQVSPSNAMKGAESFARTLGRTFRTADLLVLSQVALAFSLLVGAGLMIRSFQRLSQVDTGFQPEHVLTLRIPAPPERQMPDPFAVVTYFTRILDTAGSQAGVDACALITTLPFSNTNSSMPIYPEGRAMSQMDKASDVSFHLVSAGYFRSLGIPLLRGRLLSEREPQPVVSPVSTSGARAFSPSSRISSSMRSSVNGWPHSTGLVKTLLESGSVSKPRRAIRSPSCRW